MARFSLDNYFNMLFDIDQKTNDFNLEEDEYIRIMAIKSENDSTVVVDNNSNDGDVEIKGKVTVEHIHKFIDLPEGVSAEEVARLINETTSSDNWIKSLANNIRFQLADLKAKSKIEGKQKRSRGII